MQAVILAAGLGSRIRHYHDLPKGLIRVGRQPIIAESIAKLKQHGIQDIIVVTGYQAHCYQSLAEDPAVTLVHNPKFDQSSSLYSLYCARTLVKDNFLLLESDLIYQASAIDVLCQAKLANAILLSDVTGSGDEVYVQADQQQLIAMCKQLAALNINQVLGEFVGISKVDIAAYHWLINWLDSHDRNHILNAGYYEEDGLVALTKRYPVYCLKIADLLWCEIDTIEHLQKAKLLYQTITLEQTNSSA